MAEHDKKLFEHEFEEKLRKLDENIKIPEIPDAQSIFDRAENEKTNAVPLKKYSRYIAAAAAVVLICVAVPLVSSAENAASELQGNIEAPKSFFGYTTADQMTEAEMFEEPEGAVPEAIEEETKNESIEFSPELTNKEPQNFPMEDMDGLEAEKGENATSSKKNVKKILEAYFKENDVELNPQIGPEEVFRSYSLAEEINKKRSIDVTVDEESVSIILFDNSAGEEILCAFWMQGKYKESFYDGEKYIVKTFLRLSGDMVKADDYLPMFGDAEGTSFVSENEIFVPEAITKGAMTVTAEINVATGEYKLFAELV